MSAVSSSPPPPNAFSDPSVSYPYEPPAWCRDRLVNAPRHGRLKLANLPTPVYRVNGNGPRPSTTGGTATTASESNNKNNNNETYRCPLLRTCGERGIRLLAKRDDATGGPELGGNKVRKLEFLVADALAQRATDVVTAGGAQSNHCRATAAACRAVSTEQSVEPHLILRTPNADPKTKTTKNEGNSNKNDDDDDDALGLVGNLLIDRMVGANIYTCTPGEYGRLGSTELLERLRRHLLLQRGDNERIVYTIPVGGSNGIGTWGYINAVDELLQQLQPQHERGHEQQANGTTTTTTTATTTGSAAIDHVVFACGSGGTAAGIALGFALAYEHRHGTAAAPSAPTATKPKPPQVHGMGVCDDPDYFYRYIAGIAKEMGLQVPATERRDDGKSSEETMIVDDPIERYVRQSISIHQARGDGYAKSTPEELEFIRQFAYDTGIVLDPVYSGKALYHFYTRVLKPDARRYENQTILFWHTGGTLGLYDKCRELVAGTQLYDSSPCHRLDIYGTKQAQGEGNESIPSLYRSVIDISTPSPSPTTNASKDPSEK